MLLSSRPLWHLSRALAIENRLPEPAAIEDALQPPLALFGVRPSRFSAISRTSLPPRARRWPARRMAC